MKSTPADALPLAQPDKFLEMAGPSPDFDTKAAIAVAEARDWKVVMVTHQNAVTTILFEHKDGNYGAQVRRQMQVAAGQAQA